MWIFFVKLWADKVVCKKFLIRLMHVMYFSLRSGYFHKENSPIKVDNSLFRLKNGTSHFLLVDLNNVSQCYALVKFWEEIDLNKEMVSKLNYKSQAVLSAFTVGFIKVLLKKAFVLPFLPKTVCVCTFCKFSVFKSNFILLPFVHLENFKVWTWTNR